MKVIAFIYTSTNKPEWSALNFKPYRNEDNVLVFPEARWIETSLIEELDIKVGDFVE